MKREFVHAELFEKSWKALGLTDDDLRIFQGFLQENISKGDIINGTGGARKIRWALDKGKSGGIRIIYVDFEIYEKVYLMLAYPKSVKDNLGDKEKKFLKNISDQIAKELDKKSKFRREEF